MLYRVRLIMRKWPFGEIGLYEGDKIFGEIKNEKYFQIEGNFAILITSLTNCLEKYILYVQSSHTPFMYVYCTFVYTRFHCGQVSILFSFAIIHNSSQIDVTILKKYIINIDTYLLEEAMLCHIIYKEPHILSLA